MLLSLYLACATVPTPELAAPVARGPSQYFVALGEPSDLLTRSWMNSPEIRDAFFCGRVLQDQERPVECYDLGNGYFAAWFPDEDSCLLADTTLSLLVRGHYPPSCSEWLLTPARERTPVEFRVYSPQPFRGQM
jgi:hypothetical protein